MDRKQSFRMLGFGIVVVLVAFVAKPAGAAIVGITAATWDVADTNPITEDANLTSITAGTTYSALTGATSAAVVDSGSLGGLLLYAVNGTAPANGLAAVADGLNATSGSANIGDGVNFFFSQNVDGKNLFFVDFGSVDAAVVRPIDGAGDLIGDFALSTQSDGGVVAGFARLTANGLPTNNLRGVVFNTSDFTGTGTLAGVEGIRLAGATLDPLVVGIAAVPEPGSLASLFVGACGMVLRRRRKS